MVRRRAGAHFLAKICKAALARCIEPGTRCQALGRRRLERMPALVPPSVCCRKALLLRRVWSIRSESQLCEQFLGILEVGCAHRRLEPTVNGFKQCERPLVFALGVPEAAKTDGDPQFPKTSALLPSNGQGLAVAVFGLSGLADRLQQISTQAAQFNFRPAILC